MASYVLDEFLGAGALKDIGQKFAEDGWDDVPTLKVIDAEDMEALELTDAQRDALELRIYLHNRSLMKYADRMEASRMGLIKLMSMKPTELASKFKMRKTHVATFVDTSMACGVQLPPDLPRASSARRRSFTASRLIEDANSVKYTEVPRRKPLYKPPPFELHRSTLSDASSGTSPARKLGSRNSHARNSPPRKSNAGELGPRNGYGRNSPPRKSNAGELGSRISHARSSPPRKSNAGDLGFRNGRNSPPRKSNAGELGSRNGYGRYSPPRKSNAGDLGSRNGYGRNSPPRKSNAGDLGFRNGRNSPPRKSNAGDLGFRNGYGRNSPPRKSNAGELGFNGWSSPPRKSNAGDLGFRNGYGRNSPPRKSNAGDLGFNGWSSPPRKSNAGDLGFRNGYGRNSPPRKSNAGDLGFSGCSSPPRKSNAGDLGFRNGYGRNSPPRKSNAGELGFNGWSSPPRKSNAGDLGFRNGYGRNSPPRKSNAGELGFNGWSSPPRKSNAGDLGFRNGYGRNSPPRKSNAGDLGFNGWSSPPRKSNVGEFGFNGNSCGRDSPPRRSSAGRLGFEQPAWVRPVDATEGPYTSKGVFSATPTKRQLCGMVKVPSSDKVAKISALEKVFLRQLAPEHSYGVGSRTLKGSRKLPPFKASNLWTDKPTLFFCIRRPGCVMCRAEAHQLFARKPIFDALGVQLVAVLLEDIDEEVWAFWPRYWAGMVVLDEKRDFFRALGGGKLMKDSLFTGFFLNSIARHNWKRAMKTGIQYNTRGEGTIKGGMFIVRRGKAGVAYQFAEKNFGDWAPLDEVLRVCHVIREEGDSDGY